jgi:hypothetical protein
MTSFRFVRFLALSGLSLGAFAVTLQACSGSDDEPATPSNTTDSGKVDTGGKDAAPPVLTESLKVLNAEKVDVDADLSCLGVAPSDAGTDAGGPAPGELVDVTFKVIEFGGGGSDVVVNADVDLFYKNTVLGGARDVTGKTGATDPNRGLVTLKIPFGQRFTYRVNPNDALRTFVYFDSDPVTKTTGNYELTAITKSKYDQFALAITGKTGFLTAKGTGIYSARVMDCADHEVSNAIVEFVDAANGQPLTTGPGDADLKPVHYLTDNDLPSTDRHWTSRSGLIAAINVPETTAGGKKLMAIAKGIYGSSKEIRKFAEADLEITAEAVNFRSIVSK